MTELFPSIIPDDADTYSYKDLMNWDWLQVVRPIAAELKTDKINGASTQIEVTQYLSGRFSKQQLDAMREEIKTEDPDFAEIPDTETDLSSFSE
jgi:hypothetical protein